MAVSDELLKQTYTENYFKGEEYTDYLQDKDVLQHNFKNRLDAIFKTVSKSSLVNVLEIGCAYGFFAEVLHQKLANVPYVGYDVVEEAIAYGRDVLGQNVFCEDYMETIAGKKYSDVFMWDVIEHLPHPEKMLEKISKEVQSGGRLYITTGDIGALVPRLQKEKWRMIHPPSHLQYFSKETITKLLKTHGFKVVSVSYPTLYRSFKLIFYSLFILRKTLSPWLKKLYEWIPAKLSIPLNTFDIMFVIAVRE